MDLQNDIAKIIENWFFDEEENPQVPAEKIIEILKKRLKEKSNPEEYKIILEVLSRGE